MHRAGRVAQVEPINRQQEGVVLTWKGLHLQQVFSSCQVYL